MKTGCGYSDYLNYELYNKTFKEKAKELGLFEYPEIQDYDQKSLLGVRLDRLTEKKIKYLNATFGDKYQFRMYILVFKDKPLVISEQQKSYWQGGNKNEFVLCLGYNTKTHKVDWCNPFSWCDSPKLEVATKRYFRERWQNLREINSSKRWR